MLNPSVVGEIAHGTPFFGDLCEDDARALIRHDLAYAVCSAADSAGSTLPPAADVLLRTAARQQALRSISVAATATSVSQLLTDAGVRSIIYKGPALAVQTTGSFVGRGSADVDVLIDGRDTATTDRALRDAGCVSRSGYAGPPSRWERYHRPERAYSGLPVTIDLHWRVDSGPGYFRLPFSKAFQRGERLDHDGLQVTTFDRVDALLATAAHGAKERWWRWFWALDAVRQVEQLEPDLWTLARSRARESGTSRALDLCLAIAAESGARMPSGIAPTAGMAEVARSWFEQSSGATSVEWSNSAALSRRKARWIIADSRLTALDGFARAAARLVADRRAPGAPQK
ncbi:MAG: nucleotidyltransferase family protein, partial [bacterium]|nr:nucleotidyltransferase family protein [bacterium]